MSRKIRKKDLCEVCGKPGDHKHEYRYCKVCQRKTVFVTAFFGGPWTCKEHTIDLPMPPADSKEPMHKIERLFRLSGWKRIS